MRFGQAMYEDEELTQASWDGVVGLGFRELAEVTKVRFGQFGLCVGPTYDIRWYRPINQPILGDSRASTPPHHTTQLDHSPPSSTPSGPNTPTYPGTSPSFSPPMPAAPSATPPPRSFAWAGTISPAWAQTLPGTMCPWPGRAWRGRRRRRRRWVGVLCCGLIVYICELPSAPIPLYTHIYIYIYIYI